MFLFCVGIAPILSLRLLIRTTLGFQAAGQKRGLSHTAAYADKLRRAKERASAFATR